MMMVTMIPITTEATPLSFQLMLANTVCIVTMSAGSFHGTLLREMPGALAMLAAPQARFRAPWKGLFRS